MYTNSNLGYLAFHLPFEKIISPHEYVEQVDCGKLIAD